MNKDTAEQSIETLEEELQLYKRLIADLPFEINYYDEITNKQVTKKSNERTLTIIPEEQVKIEEEQSPFYFPMLEHHFERLEQFLKPLFDLVPHHIVIIDKNGLVTLCNQQTLDDFNVSLENVLGKPIQDLLQIDESQIRLLQTLRTGKEIVSEEVLDKNYGICNTRIIYDQFGNLVRVISLFHFLNPLKEAEKMNMIGQISASIAHEIRNPLTTVRGYLQLMSQEEIPIAADLLSSLLIPELDRANKIISDFLTVSKNAPVKRTPEKIASFFTHFKNLMYSEAMMRDVELIVALDEELTDTIVLINHNELLQVFINLFNNSIDSKQDTQPLVISIEGKKLNNDIHIIFKDNGIGMSESSLRYIFDPFFSTKETGTGLGLSLSKKIIELHNGSISVSSTLHKGTRFFITLPINNTN
ncbi:PAS domain-containing protein [Anaerobacillus sp. CMMVII]|uniref:two-component system sensor histidine kinase NtrB n=1 Tax=Anaerobacillus sp. CMMVII TaxID=2755588 RepID=UPI0021B83575|nr:ATP-binding protein [Anaerobacillus sp. CMMVII]MCT8140007.1 PAS domain-containing protein [Anaerobacillus sp. CMMVII]